MPALNQSNFDFTKLVFTEAKANTSNGGRYATIGYGSEKQQVSFQLGMFPHEPLFTKFGADWCNQHDHSAGQQIKIDLTDNARQFLKTLEQCTLEAAEHHTVSWFKKKLTADKIASLYHPLVKDGGEHGDRAHLKVYEDGSYATEVYTVTIKDGKRSGAVRGTLADVTSGSWVVPVVKVKGGAWFQNGTFGTCLWAAQLLVIKDEGASAGQLSVDLGEVEMAEGNEDMSD